MFKENQLLISDADFDNAMFFAVRVSVWQNDEIIDYGGQIKKHDADVVNINGGYYMKKLCKFKVR